MPPAELKIGECLQITHSNAQAAAGASHTEQAQIHIRLRASHIECSRPFNPRMRVVPRLAWPCSAGLNLSSCNTRCIEVCGVTMD